MSSLPPLSPLGLVVLGMHRSGTSAMSQLVCALGLHPGRSEDLLGATAANPRGHHEPAPLVRLNEAAIRRVGRFWHAPLTDPSPYRDAAFDGVRAEIHDTFRSTLPEHGWTYKDPRLCVLWDLYVPLFPIPPLAVFVARDPVEVADSLHRRDGMNVEHALALWELYNRLALAASGSFATSRVFVHDGLLADPASTAESVSELLAVAGMEVDPSDLAAARSTIEPALAHSRGADVDVELTRSQRELWDQLRAMAETGVAQAVDPPSAELRARIDRRAQLVNENIAALQHGWIDPVEHIHRPT